jgi:hypothetical protein
MTGEGDANLRILLSKLDPKARDHLRRVLIRDQADRDAIAMQLMRYRDENGQRWADVIDFLRRTSEKGKCHAWMIDWSP